MPDNERPIGLIYSKIPQIIGELKPIGKDAKNREQGYAFRSIDQVYTCLKDLLAKHGVFMLPFVVEHAETQHTTQRGTIMHRVTMLVDYNIVAGDGSSVTARVRTEGMDTSDKATNKALSFAFKYCCFQVFCIPVAGEQDGDAESPTIQAPATPAKPATPPPPKFDRTGALAKLRAAFPGDNMLWLEDYLRNGMQDAEGHAIAWLGPDEDLDNLDDRHLALATARVKGLVEKVQAYADANTTANDTTP